MVTGYTANEYGDQLIASLQDPFQNVIKITDWEVIAGLTTPNTYGVVVISAGSTTINGIGTNFSHLSNGSEIILGNRKFQVSEVTSNNILELTTPPNFSTGSNGIDYYMSMDSINYFEYEFRWSHTNGSYSEYMPLNKTSNIGDLLSLDFDGNLPLYLDLKAEIAGLAGGNSLSLISITYTTQTEDGIVEACPNFCVECTDPFAMDGCANIIVEDCAGNLFNPYNLNKSTNFIKELSGLVSNIFGHTVNYFRTEPDMRTEDVTLMEYSLHNVVDNKDIKILVPGNEFPEESIQFDIFGMDFADFEIHITMSEFEKMFGKGKIPRSKDYMYIPIINRMYEIHTTALADEFNKSNTYWRVMLTKYQDRTSVIKNQFDTATDSLTTGIEEIFGERQAEEQEKVSKPQQFQSVSTTYRDGIRKFVHTGLQIVDSDIKNRWTVVSKNYYDSSSVPDNMMYIEYDVNSNLSAGKNMAITGWIKPQFTDTGVDHFIIGDSTASTGFKTYLNDSEFKVIANGIPTTFTHGITLDTSKWYAFVLNISNEFSTVSLSMYSLNESGLPQSASTALVEEFNQVKPASLIWSGSTNFELRGNRMHMTNIRIFDQMIEEEQRGNVLNQYVVRDNQLSRIIDNAIPSLGFQKFKHSR